MIQACARLCSRCQAQRLSPLPSLPCHHVTSRPYHRDISTAKTLFGAAACLCDEEPGAQAADQHKERPIRQKPFESCHLQTVDATDWFCKTLLPLAQLPSSSQIVIHQAAATPGLSSQGFAPDTLVWCMMCNVQSRQVHQGAVFSCFGTRETLCTSDLLVLPFALQGVSVWLSSWEGAHGDKPSRVLLCCPTSRRTSEGKHVQMSNLRFHRQHVLRDAERVMKVDCWTAGCHTQCRCSELTAQQQCGLIVLQPPGKLPGEPESLLP